jgi:hypothetical protein
MEDTSRVCCEGRVAMMKHPPNNIGVRQEG